MKILCSARTDRLERTQPTITETGKRYTLSFHLPPDKLDRLKVSLETDRVVIQAEFLRKLVTPEGLATHRVPYEQVWELPPHVERRTFFPLLENDTLKLTLFVKEDLSAQVVREAAHSC